MVVLKGLLTLSPPSPMCCRANEEIAQVRAKAKGEGAALHAGLRKEQMKVESLERALQQKVRPPCLSSPCAPCTCRRVAHPEEKWGPRLVDCAGDLGGGGGLS